MKTRSYSPCSLGRSVIPLGQQLDHEALCIRFDVSEWLAEYPGGMITGYAIPPGGDGYPMMLEMDGSVAVWVIRDSDTAQAGRGEIQLAIVGADGQVLHSANGYTAVVRSAMAQAGGDPPEAIRPWFEEIEKKASGAVRYDKDQYLTDLEKAQARWNIGAGTGGSGTGGGMTELLPATTERLGGIKIGSGLKVAADGTASVDTADAVEEDNTKPITSAAVHTTVGNIEILLQTI